jgi:hypothetical protein
MEILATVEPRYSANLDLARKIFGPFDKKTFKIDLDTVDSRHNAPLDITRTIFGPFDKKTLKMPLDITRKFFDRVISRVDCIVQTSFYAKFFRSLRPHYIEVRLYSNLGMRPYMLEILHVTIIC